MTSRQKSLIENFIRNVIREELHESTKFNLTPYDRLGDLKKYIRDKRFYSELSQYSLDDAFSEFISMFGDFDPDDYSKIFGISLNQVRRLLSDNWTDEDQSFQSYWNSYLKSKNRKL